MNTRILPARGGRKWLIDGYLTYRRNPALLVLTVFSYWAVILMLDVVPLLGSIAAAVVTPALMVGVLNVCRDLDQGKSMVSATIFSGFQRNRNALFILGALRVARILAIILVASVIDGGEMLRVFSALTPDKPPTPEQMSAFWTPLYVLPFFLPVFMAFWYAHMLAAWHGLPVLKALFFSFIACWRNWRAFALYGFTLLAWGMALPSVLMYLLTLFIPPGMAVIVVLVPMLVMFMPVVFASFYISYRDVFEESGE